MGRRRVPPVRHPHRRCHGVVRVVHPRHVRRQRLRRGGRRPATADGPRPPPIDSQPRHGVDGQEGRAGRGNTAQRRRHPVRRRRKRPPARARAGVRWQAAVRRAHTVGRTHAHWRQAVGRRNNPHGRGHQPPVRPHHRRPIPTGVGGHTLRRRRRIRANYRLRQRGRRAAAAITTGRTAWHRHGGGRGYRPPRGFALSGRRWR